MLNWLSHLHCPQKSELKLSQHKSFQCIKHEPQIEAVKRLRSSNFRLQRDAILHRGSVSHTKQNGPARSFFLSFFFCPLKFQNWSKLIFLPRLLFFIEAMIYFHVIGVHGCSTFNEINLRLPRAIESQDGVISAAIYLF